MSIETAARAQAVALLRDAELDAYADELESGGADLAAVLAERERCAKICERMVVVGRAWTHDQQVAGEALFAAAKAIRNAEVKP